MFEAYHDVTAAQHGARFKELSGLGFRPISLSVYGAPPEVRYAAVWVKRDGPAWQEVHGVDSKGYQHFLDEVTGKGYAPSIVSATGPENQAVFAAIFEQGIGRGWLARHGMSSSSDGNGGTFQHANNQAVREKLMLRSIAIYGAPNARRYAAVWHPNPHFVKWHTYPAETGESYPGVFATETQLPGYKLHAYRPAYIAVSDDHTYGVVFKDDVVGEWVAHHDLSASAYQHELDKQKATGSYPICLQGGGVGEHTRYAVIFARDDVPARREWKTDGDAVPKLAGLDELMKAFMQANGARAAQLAVARHGEFKFSRAYTWAEPGYRPPRITDRFLLASCSKMFLEAAVQSLYAARRLRPDTKVYPLLGFSHPKDPRSDEITIQQLLDHRGGYDDTSTGSRFDPTYKMREIAESLHLDRPVTKLDIARYMYARPLDHAPGEEYKYSNYGYLLSGAVVEKVTGKPYFDYLHEAVLEPAGITEVAVYPTRAAGRKPDMAIAEDEGFGLDPLDLRSSRQVPSVYGGDGEINEVGEPNCGLCASARAMVQFIHMHAVWGNGRRAPNSARDGSTPGTSTTAKSRSDDVDWAFTINTRDWPPDTSPTLKDLPHDIDRVLDKVKLD